MGAVLDIVGQPESLCGNIISFVKESLERFEYDRFVPVRS